MGALLSLVRGLLPRPALPPAQQVRQQALDRLRRSDMLMASKIDAKRRRVGDVDRDMVEIGLRMQHANNRMSQADSQTFRALFRERAMLLDGRQRLLDVQSNIKTQLMLVEDSAALVESAEALDSGSREQAEDVANIESMMSDVTRRTNEIMSRERNVQAAERITQRMRSMDDAAFESELSALMGDDEFIGQFDTDDLQRARNDILLRLPTAPTDEPTVVRRRAAVTNAQEAVSEMGL